MDLTGRARSFPKPGAFLVNVRSLSVEEEHRCFFAMHGLQISRVMERN